MEQEPIEVRVLSVVDNLLKIGPFEFSAYDLVGSQTTKLTEEELNTGWLEAPGAQPIPHTGFKPLGLLERSFEPKTIIDIGANVGIWALHAKLCHPNAKILCVEPVRETYEVLKKNIERASNGIAHMHAGIAPRGQTEVVLGWHPSNPGGASFQHANTRNWAVAPAVRLEDLLDSLGEKQVHFVKLDVEGMEYQIMQDVTDWRRIKMLSVEMHQFLPWPAWANKAVYDAAEAFLVDVNRNFHTMIEVRRPDKPAFVIGH